MTPSSRANSGAKARAAAIAEQRMKIPKAGNDVAECKTALGFSRHGRGKSVHAKSNNAKRASFVRKSGDQ
jgi:hypothetical protein